MTRHKVNSILQPLAHFVGSRCKNLSIILTEDDPLKVETIWGYLRGLFEKYLA
jgi:hypothetical protein